MKIQRINFIEKKTFAVTYQKMILIGAGLFVLCSLLWGVQKLRFSLMERQISRLTLEVEKLKSDRERQVREASLAVDSSLSPARKTLLGFFSESIAWSGVLRELTSRTPPSLWLTRMQSYDKAELASKKGILLSGQSTELNGVAHFMRQLSESSYFESVVLTSLKQQGATEGDLYQFDLDVVLSPQNKGKG